MVTLADPHISHLKPTFRLQGGPKGLRNMTFRSMNEQNERCEIPVALR